MSSMGVFEDAVQPAYDGGPNMNLNPQGASGGSVSYGSDTLAPAPMRGGSLTSQHRGESRTRGGGPPKPNAPLHEQVSYFANHDFASDPMGLYDGVANLFGSWKPSGLKRG